MFSGGIDKQHRAVMGLANFSELINFYFSETSDVLIILGE